MNGLIILAAACEGYACPPGGQVPAGEVEVVRVAQDLAATGVDPMGVVWWVCAGTLLLASGIATFARSRRKQN